MTYQWWKCIPREECNHEPEPREEENPAMLIERVQDGNGLGFAGTGVDLWRNEQDFEHVGSH